jgi:GNAT superfamily N-acetyltransferase
MVLADVRGIGGYALGASDTIAFRRWQEAEWWPSLRRQYLGADRTGADGELIELLFDPPEPDPRLCADYPAHLHIDLAPRARGHGHGRALIEALIDRLCAGSVRGVHLEVAPSNHNAIEFYRHLGFREYSRSDGGIVMVRRLNGLATR